MKKLEWLLVIGGIILVGVFVFGAYRFPSPKIPSVIYGPPMPSHPLQLGHGTLVKHVDDPMATFGAPPPGQYGLGPQNPLA